MAQDMTPKNTIDDAMVVPDTTQKAVTDQPSINSKFWRKDAKMRMSRLEELSRRIEAQQREQANLEQEMARLEAEEAKTLAKAQADDTDTLWDDEEDADLAPNIGPSTPASPDSAAEIGVPTAVLASTVQSGGFGAQTSDLPHDFGFEDEHPQVKLPFTVTIDGQKVQGESISFTHVHGIATDETALDENTQHLVLITMPFDGFTVTLQPQVVVQSSKADGRVVLRFSDPTGDHLPQLRYILNSVIAGDVVGVNGMLSYSGPLQPKTPKREAVKSTKDRVKSIFSASVSALLVVAALGVVYKRYTTGHELHPVQIVRDGQMMRATSPGQIAYLNPAAKPGEVLYAINSNSGDVLNFQMPCDCEVTVNNGISTGATVLPSDLVLTVFQPSTELKVQTLMSIEGLSRAMGGDRVYMDMNDGRSLSVDVTATDATRAATMNGDLFVPVTLVPQDGALTEADLGKSAAVRLSKSLWQTLGLN